jgi:beta-galactosidase beta subunit
MMASSQHNDDYEEEDNYLFAETIEEEEVLRLEQKKSK